MKVDVLQTMDHAIRCVRPGISPEHAEWHRRLTEARAAVAELIEADKEYDSAKKASVRWSHESVKRMNTAEERRAAALAKVKP